MNATIVPLWLSAMIRLFPPAAAVRRDEPWRAPRALGKASLERTRQPHKPLRTRSALPRPAMRFSDG